MDLTLIFIVVVFVGYSIFKDYSFAQEREKLQLKLMSKDVGEYVSSITPDDNKNSEEVVDEFIPVEDASFEQILKSEDKL